MRMLVIAAAAGLVASTAAAEEPPLRLSCKGRGTAVSHGANLHFLASGRLSTYDSSRTTHPEARVLFELKEGAARVHLPSSLVTQVNSGGEDGWWTATDLKVTDEAITGRLRLNLVNKPSFRIDRLTGDMELGGAYPFDGSCEKTDSVTRKF